VTEGSDKPILRDDVRAARTALTPSQIDGARVGVRSHVLSRYASARRVAAYRPLRTEPGSVELLDAFAAGGAEVIVPIVLDDRDLDWSPWPAGGPLGVDAISRADLVLVPALGVDRRGVRLGRGGGSYDRALRRVRPGVPVVALIYDGELVERLPEDGWDVPVTAVVTPSGWHPLV
jgi:5-formyltetrahydrofolate cyclo-ligase